MGAEVELVTADFESMSQTNVNTAAVKASVITDEDEANGMVIGPNGFIYKPPPASKNLIIEMQVSVTKCETWREVLDLVDRNGDLFDFRNTATAVHRVARFGAEESHNCRQHPVWPRLLLLLRAKARWLTARSLSDAAWGLAKLGCADEEIFRRISVRAQALHTEIDPQGLALIAWAMATIGRQDDDLMNTIAKESQLKLKDFGPQNIANLIWATATLQFKCDPLHAGMIDQSLRNLESFSSQELAMVNWALTKLAFPVDDNWRAPFRRRVMQLKEYAPSELSMLAWALATRGEYDPEMMAYIARRSIELMRSFTGQNIATIVWAIGTVSYKDDPCIDELLRMMLGAIIGRAPEFQPLNLALMSWGLAKLSYKADVAFEAMCASATAQMDRFVPQNLVQILWACATSGYRDDAFLYAVARTAKRTFADFSSQHLSNFIWACARLGFNDDKEVLHRFSSEAVKKMHLGSPQHLSNIAWAVSQLGAEHFPGCLTAVAAETSRRLQEFDRPSLMMLSDSLYEAGFDKEGKEPLMGVLRSHVMRMGDELMNIFTEGLPLLCGGAAAERQLAEYQRRMRAIGLVTFGYEHTHNLLTKLGLCDGEPWQHAEASSLDGWTTNARRTTTARRFSITYGSESIGDDGTIFTSAFASVAEDHACELSVAWLGQGKPDSPSVGRAGRSGDAECRAFLGTHRLLRETARQHGGIAPTGTVSFHTSGVPCLSCVGVAAQFRRLYPGVRVCFTFAPREQGVWGGNDIANEGFKDLSQGAQQRPPSRPPKQEAVQDGCSTSRPGTQPSGGYVAGVAVGGVVGSPQRFY